MKEKRCCCCRSAGRRSLYIIPAYSMDIHFHHRNFPFLSCFAFYFNFFLVSLCVYCFFFHFYFHLSLICGVWPRNRPEQDGNIQWMRDLRFIWYFLLVAFFSAALRSETSLLCASLKLYFSHIISISTKHWIKRIIAVITFHSLYCKMTRKNSENSNFPRTGVDLFFDFSLTFSTNFALCTTFLYHNHPNLSVFARSQAFN